MNRKSLTRIAATTTLAAGLSIAGLTAAQADGGGHSTDKGDCSARSTFELKASPDGNRIRVEVRVDTGHQAQLWDWAISDNGSVVLAGQSRTEHSSDGRFRLEKRIANLMGRDSIDLAASNAATGETCMGHVVLAGR